MKLVIFFISIVHVYAADQENPIMKVSTTNSHSMRLNERDTLLETRMESNTVRNQFNTNSYNEYFNTILQDELKKISSKPYATNFFAATLGIVSCTYMALLVVHYANLYIHDSPAWWAIGIVSSIPFANLIRKKTADIILEYNMPKCGQSNISCLDILFLYTRKIAYYTCSFINSSVPFYITQLYCLEHMGLYYLLIGLPTILGQTLLWGIGIEQLGESLYFSYMCRFSSNKAIYQEKRQLIRRVTQYKRTGFDATTINDIQENGIMHKLENVEVNHITIKPCCDKQNISMLAYLLGPISSVVAFPLNYYALDWLNKAYFDTTIPEFVIYILAGFGGIASSGLRTYAVKNQIENFQQHNTKLSVFPTLYTIIATLPMISISYFGFQNVPYVVEIVMVCNFIATFCTNYWGIEDIFHRSKNEEEQAFKKALDIFAKNILYIQ